MQAQVRHYVILSPGGTEDDRSGPEYQITIVF